MTTVRIIGDCYTKLGLKHTSKSQACMKDDIHFFRYVVLSPKERLNLPSNASFKGGTLVHEVVQAALCQKKTIDEVIEASSSKPQAYQINYDDFCR